LCVCVCVCVCVLVCVCVCVVSHVRQRPCTSPLAFKCFYPPTSLPRVASRPDQSPRSRLRRQPEGRRTQQRGPRLQPQTNDTIVEPVFSLAFMSSLRGGGQRPSPLSPSAGRPAGAPPPNAIYGCIKMLFVYSLDIDILSPSRWLRTR
jgi:hypothetical protein